MRERERETRTLWFANSDDDLLWQFTRGQPCHATVNSEDSQRQRLRTGESSLRSFTFSTSSLFVVKWSLHSCVRLNRFHVTKMRRPILRGEGGGQE